MTSFIMKSLLGFGGLALAGVVVGVGVVNRDRFYDKRFGGVHFSKDVCLSLRDAVECGQRRPVMGMDFPIESVVLVLVHEETNKLIMSLSKRNEKTEWTLIGGKTRSQKRHELSYTDFSDDRFINDGHPITPDQCADILFENPKTSLAREVIKGLTGNEKTNANELNDFNWIIQKIYRSHDWVFVKTSRSNPEGFSTYMGICRVTLSDNDIEILNTTIQQYDDREHTYFVPKIWSVKEFELNGKNKNRIEVTTDDNHPVGTYNANIMFVHYWKEFNSLITKNVEV